MNKMTYALSLFFTLWLVPSISLAVAYTDGPAVAVKNFKGSGPYDYMGKGLADMVVTDIATLANDKKEYANCKMVVVEWERRGEILKEIALSQSKYADPATRMNTDKLIDPNVFVEGAVTTTQDSTSWSIQLKDAKTGKLIGTDAGTAAGGDIMNASEGIARRLADKLCRKGRTPSGQPTANPSLPYSPPSPSSPSTPPPTAAKPAPSTPANDVVNTINSLKGLFGR